MSRNPFSPAPPPNAADAPLHLGFTAWVELTRPGIADVLAFSRGLDRHLGSLGLVRSMNPLHMLVWSPERSLTADDQADLIEWMASERRVAVVSIGHLQPHAGIPSVRGREKVLTARPSDPEWLALFRTYRSLQRDAQQAIELIRQASSMPGRA
jgi:hypothetical protein